MREYLRHPRLCKNLRSRLHTALMGGTKVGSAVRDLGCTIPQLRMQLEAQFEPGMSWTNYGEWEVDHIYPLSLVDLEDRDQLLRACHYSNLRPMWKADNISKGAKTTGKLPLIEPFSKASAARALADETIFLSVTEQKRRSRRKRWVVPNENPRVTQVLGDTLVAALEGKTEDCSAWPPVVSGRGL